METAQAGPSAIGRVEFSALFDLPALLAEELHPFLPDFSFRLIELPQMFCLSNAEVCNQSFEHNLRSNKPPALCDTATSLAQINPTAEAGPRLHPQPQIPQAPQDSGGWLAGAPHPSRAVFAFYSEAFPRMGESLVHKCLAADHGSIGEISHPAQ
jgi:hypothetical protein